MRINRVKLVFPIVKYPTVEVVENAEDLPRRRRHCQRAPILLQYYRSLRDGRSNFLSHESVIARDTENYGRDVDCATTFPAFFDALARQYSSISSSVRPFVSGTM